MKGKEKKTLCGKQYYCFICIGIFYKGNSNWFCLNRHKSSLDMNRKRNMIHKRCVYEQLLRALPVMVPEASFTLHVSVSAYALAVAGNEGMISILGPSEQSQTR